MTVFAGIEEKGSGSFSTTGDSPIGGGLTQLIELAVDVVFGTAHVYEDDVAMVWGALVDKL